MTKDFQMFGCTVSVVDGPKHYKRRKDLTEELVAQSGRNDWAISMGMMPAPKDVVPPREVQV